MAETSIDKIKTSYDQYVVKPLNFFGIGGFVFDIEGDASVNLTNEITDHYAEDNTVINDHTAVRAKRITLKNYVGELADLAGDTSKDVLQRVTQKLTILNSYLPALTDAATQKIPNIIQNIDDSLENVSADDVLDIYSLVQNLSPPVTKQEQAYMYLKALRDQKILVSIQTPFEFMSNMAIETIVAHQGEKSKGISDFTITFKEIRYATTQITAVSKQGRNVAQSQTTDNRGRIAGKNSALIDLLELF